MTILDENIIESQRLLLQNWKIRTRQIGVDISRKGIQDDEIIPFLLACSHPTFVTRDLGFFTRKLCHAGYCILCLEVGRYEVATFVRFFLRHSAFNTHAKRMGNIVRGTRRGLHVWKRHAHSEKFYPWDVTLS